MTITYSKLGQSDAPAIALLQFDSWRRSYTDVLSDDYIAGAMKNDIEAVWSNWSDTKIVVGALTETGALVGFATYLTGKLTYIDNFHVDRAYQGQGVAATLFGAGAQVAAANGAERLWLTVLESNARARAFYMKMGGDEGPVKDDDMLGTPVRAIPVHWHDLHAVQKICAQV